MSLHPFPLRPAVSRAQGQTLAATLLEFGFSRGFVVGVDEDGYAKLSCDPNMSLQEAVFLLEHAKFRLLSGTNNLPGGAPRA